MRRFSDLQRAPLSLAHALTWAAQQSVLWCAVEGLVMTLICIQTRSSAVGLNDLSQPYSLLGSISVILTQEVSS